MKFLVMYYFEMKPDPTVNQDDSVECGRGHEVNRLSRLRPLLVEIQYFPELMILRCLKVYKHWVTQTWFSKWNIFFKCPARVLFARLISSVFKMENILPDVTYMDVSFSHAMLPSKKWVHLKISRRVNLQKAHVYLHFQYGCPCQISFPNHSTECC